MTRENEQIDSRPRYDVKIDRSQGVVIGDNARVEQHFHGVPPAPAVDLAAAEAQYRQWVVDRYNWLGFGGFEQADLMLTDVPLTKVFVRLSLTAEKVVRVAEEAQGPESEEQVEERRGRAATRQPKRAGVARAQDEITKRTAPGREEKDRQRAQERIIKVQEPVALVEALKKNVLLVGEPGAGKSTLLRWLAVTFAQRQQRATDRLGPEADADRLPVYVELGRLPEVYLRGDGGRAPAWWKLLPELMAEQETFDGTATAVLTQALADGRCLVLCDGLDEVADRLARSRITQSLVEFVRRPAGNRVVIGSRPAGMAETESSIRPGFERCQVERFTPAEVQQFFRFWYQLDTTLSPEVQTTSADELYAKLERTPGTLKLATTPLLATILLLIWRNEGSLPARRVEVYERCCKMLVESWERQHGVQYVGALASLGWQRHMRLLAPLAYAIHSREQRTSGTLQELVPVLAQALVKEGLCLEEKTASLEAEMFLGALGLRSGLLQRLGPDEYGFPHLTFQEYLAARHIGDQHYPDYIDLFMAHLHEGWWREVHLLTMGHLGSGTEGGKKASQLMLEILNRYPPPWRILRPSRHAILRLVGPGRWFPTLHWQRRLAWLLGRELELVASGYAEMIPVVITPDARAVVDVHMRRFVTEALPDEERRFVLQDLMPTLAQASPTILDLLVRTLGDHSSSVRDAAATCLIQLGHALPAVVDTLIRALDNSNWLVREEAAISLGVLGHASLRARDALIHVLTDNNRHVRRTAAFSLAELGHTSAVVADILILALTDKDWLVRRSAAASLGQIRQTSSVEGALIRALADISEPVQWAAAYSLIQLGQASPRIVDMLIRALADLNAWIPKEEAAASLIQLGQVSPVVSEALIRALADEDKYVRRRAAECLGQLGQVSPMVVDGLIRALVDTDPLVQAKAANSLGQLGHVSPEVVDALIRCLAYENFIMQHKAAASLSQLGQTSSVVDALTRALADSDSSVRLVAAYSLGALGQASPAAVEGLTCALADKDSLVRGAAAFSLGRLDCTAPAATDTLIFGLANGDTDVRRDAASSLGTLGQASPAAAEALVSALADDDSVVRRKAASSLGQLGQATPVVIDALVRALADDDFLVRCHVALCLHQLDQVSPMVVDALSRALADGDFVVRYRAAQSLGKLSQASPVVVETLIRALADEDKHVRSCAAESLGQLGQASPVVVEALVRALADDDFLVKKYAVESLGQLGHVSLTAVDVLIRTLGDNYFQDVAATSLVQLGHTLPAVVDMLIRALTNSNRVVRKEAATILGQIGQTSPKVADALMRALLDKDKFVLEAAAASLIKLNNLHEDQLRNILLALLQHTHDIIPIGPRKIALETARTLLIGRPIPGFAWGEAARPTKQRRNSYF